MGGECIPVGTARAAMVWFFMMGCVCSPCVYLYEVDMSENLLFLADPRVLMKSK